MDNIHLHREVNNVSVVQKIKHIYPINSREGYKEEYNYTYEHGYPLGYVAKDSNRKHIIVDNHVDFVILYDNNHVVGFEAAPQSVGHQYWEYLNLPAASCDYRTSGEVVYFSYPLPTDLNSLHVIWTYSLRFKHWDPNEE